jgi:hypothetical protein
VPRTHDEFAVQATFAQRSASVIADVGDRAELAVVEENGDAVPLDLQGERGPCPQVRLRAEPMPGGHVPTSV